MIKCSSTHQNIVATRRPTPIQSINTTQSKNLIKCRTVRPSTTVNPREETETVKHEVTVHNMFKLKQ